MTRHALVAIDKERLGGLTRAAALGFLGKNGLMRNPGNTQFVCFISLINTLGVDCSPYDDDVIDLMEGAFELYEADGTDADQHIGDGVLEWIAEKR